MNYYVIASGGSGSMCIRSLVFMLVAHYLDPEKKLDGKVYIRLVDMDRKSDAKEECESLIKQYERLRAQANRGVDGGMRLPEIVLESWDFTAAVRRCAWQNGVVLEEKQEITLRSLFVRGGEMDAHTEKMLNTFFSADEQNTTLDKGFYGHPNIGAVVFNYVRDDFLQEKVTELQQGREVEAESAFMHSLVQDLTAASDAAKVPLYLYGSLFGGTGASVIPNLIDVLRSIPARSGAIGPNGQPPKPWGEERLRLGVTMLLPYFKLPEPPASELKNALRPNHNNFWRQTQEALKYYDEFKVSDKVDSLLLLGTKELDVTSEIYARGAKQYQHFHVVLMAAAAAGMRFFHNELGQGALKWNLSYTANDGKPGAYQTLTFSELGLSPEATALQVMFRFSLVVSQYMQHHFLAEVGNEKLNDRLNKMQEVYQTCKQECDVTPKREGLMRKWNAGLTDDQLEMGYKEPIKAAAEFCCAYIKYFFDCAASGYDWTRYHNWNTTDEKGNPVPGGKRPDRLEGMDHRFVDLVDLTLTDRCIDESLNMADVREQKLAPYFSFVCLDAGRRADAQFADFKVAQLYDDAVKDALKKNDTTASISEIYKACYNAAAKAVQAPAT